MSQETEAIMTEPDWEDIHLSFSEEKIGRQLKREIDRSNFEFGDFVFDSYSTYWLEIIELLKKYLGLGLGECVAVIDTGISMKNASAFNVDLVSSVDLTRYSPDDRRFRSKRTFSVSARHGAPAGSWLERMLAKKPRMLVTVALANKMAR